MFFYIQFEQGFLGSFLCQQLPLLYVYVQARRYDFKAGEAQSFFDDRIRIGTTSNTYLDSYFAGEKITCNATQLLKMDTRTN